MPSIAEWRSRADLIEEIATVRMGNLVRIRLPQGAWVLRTALVSQGFFSLFGISSGGSHSEHMEAITSLVVAPQEYFKRFGSKPRQSLDQHFARPDGRPVRIVGAWPESFVFPTIGSRIFPVQAISLDESDQHIRVDVVDTIFARLSSGTSAATVASALSATLPNHISVHVVSLKDYLARSARPFAAGAMIAATMLLLACSANFANLSLVRVMSRSHDTEIRRDLGAGRPTLLRLVALDIGLFCVLALVMGIVVAMLVVASAGRTLPAEYAALGIAGVDWRAITVAFVSAIAIALPSILIGSIHAWLGLAGRPNARQTRSIVGGLRVAFLSGQIALTTAVLIPSITLGRSYYNLYVRDTGLDGSVLVATVSYPEEREGESLAADIAATVEGLRRVPGVSNAAAVLGSMVDRLVVGGGVTVRGHPFPATAKQVTSTYFSTVGSRLISGRFLNGSDRLGHVLIINETLYQQIRATIGGPVPSQTDSGAEIVGVVRDELSLTLDGDNRPIVFLPLQDPWTRCTGSACGQISYVAKAQAPREIRGAASAAILGVNSDAGVIEMATIRERLLYTVRDRAFAALVLGLFAVSALGISTAGVAGTVLFMMAQRAKELAIRRALGASTFQVATLVGKDAAIGTVIGVILGVWGGHQVTGLFRHIVFGVGTNDVLSTFGSAVLVSATVFVAVGTSMSVRTEGRLQSLTKSD